ncbi:MAG TPA: hypothetical protein VMZ26_08160 [Pyrinomonadaceae bacterium]|nr:hypothetical protein [Pyrinomonadaceae bacterium]
MAAVGKSHIDANVPDEKDFDNFLRRDMTAYATDSRDKEISVTVELLRNGPTQSGVAFPKFYCWIVKRDAKGVVMEEAAARVAAVEKKRFEVIQYFTKEKIIAEPDLVKGVFPGDVYNKILTKIKPGEK